MSGGRILFIDAYDSFSHNIITLLGNTLRVQVESIRINDSRFVLNDDAFHNFLGSFDAVVAGPGPGHPAKPEDVGVIANLWGLPDGHLLPVFGICLGFQSLVLAFGGRVERLPKPRHGLVRRVQHDDTNIFAGAGDLEATLYHSLHAQLRHAQDIVALASLEDEFDNASILMSVRHISKPFWGVQYHPESICSSGGSTLVRNWWRLVQEWNKANGRTRRSSSPLQDAFLQSDQVHTPLRRSCRTVQYRAVPLGPHTDVAQIVNALRNVGNGEPLLLESGCRNSRPVNSETGRFSIVAVRDREALEVCWSTLDHKLRTWRGQEEAENVQLNAEKAIFALKNIIKQYGASGGPDSVPFWGGLIGFISYEAGLETINVSPATDSLPRPDMWFVLIQRSLVIDHVQKLAYAQTILDGDEAWLSQMEALLRLPPTPPDSPSPEKLHPADAEGRILSGPLQDTYCDKVVACQEKLSAGESYELCLTDQTLIRNSTDAWNLYRTLRNSNPAPFGAYMRMSRRDGPGLDIVGSSPERFLSWSRRGRCQFRPIKGTVKKTAGMTRAKAEVLLGSEKERAENLMIVDLIRHDLSGVAGVHNVRVPKLMSVEEYETVFQLVSVVEGDCDNSIAPVATLAASLPPGSMTGAPKKRSCEVLRELEGINKPRGLYSGVLGYFEVGGGGDFSVVIRTAFKWSDEGFWRVGAGGAVTALSRPEEEWQEMLAKRQSLLDVLAGSES